MHGIERPDKFNKVTKEFYEQEFSDRQLLHNVIEKYSREKPGSTVIIDADANGKEITWQELDEISTLIAYKLLDMGYEKGDFLAASLLYFPELIFIEYACFKIGVVFVPIDLRLKPPAVVRYLDLVQPKGFIHLGETPVADFRQLAKFVRSKCNYIEDFLQYSAPNDCIKGSISIFQIIAEAKQLGAMIQEQDSSNPLFQKYNTYYNSIKPTDGCLVVYTTGTTGYPKPALLSHQSILVQNLVMSEGMEIKEEDRMLVNLPPNHVGGSSEQLMSALFVGGTVILLHIFDPEKTLQAVQNYKVTVIGQIPTLFEMEWRLPNYSDFDLSSLRYVVYAGQKGTPNLVENLAKMAPQFGTGYGLTECAGFCTVTPIGLSPEEVAASVGFDMPIAPVSVREKMQEDRTAGAVVPKGEIGEVCIHGPIVFEGYVNNEDATKQTISSDGYLYTGDMGYVSDNGLVLVGRSKLVLKPKGNQVFPGEIEDHLNSLDSVASSAVVGAPHGIYAEGVVAFVEKAEGAELDVEMIENHAKQIASYMRPDHTVIFEHGELPLNPLGKTDYVKLKEMALEEIETLREEGGWDRS